LKRLDVGWNPITDVGVVHLTLGSSSCGLTELKLHYTGMTDEGVRALVSALEQGALRTLSCLQLSDNEGIADAGAIFLAASIEKGHLKELESLNLVRTGIHTKGATALARAVVVHCPKLRRLYFPSKMKKSAKRLIKKLFAHKQDIYVSFC
jgi:Ran GTPase-activating protein (RanGAP) involved in mRNA processing and transport